MKKLFGMLRSLFKLYVLRQRVPLFVQIMLTNACTSLCSYCEIPLRKYEDMSTERILRLLDELSEAGTIRVGFYGGEPLLRDDIHVLVSHAKKLGLMVQLYTNGLLVKKHVETIKLTDGVFISVDGSKDLHDEFRGQGTFQKVVEAINICKQFVPVYLMTVITKANKDQLQHVSDLAKSVGAIVNYQGVFEAPGTSAKVGHLKLASAEVKQTFSDIRKIKYAEGTVALSDISLEKIINYDPSIQRVGYQLGSIKCWNGKASCVIDANGDTYSCYQFIGQEKVLNLKNVGFGEAFSYLKPVSCIGCDITCGIEYNLILSLHPKAILNLFGLLTRVDNKKLRNITHEEKSSSSPATAG